jgi:hypothetical protein
VVAAKRKPTVGRALIAAAMASCLVLAALSALEAADEREAAAAERGGGAARPSAKGNGAAAAEAPPARRRPGVGFLWTQQSRKVATAISSGKDFVDVILGPGKLGIFAEVKPPVRVMCIARSLRRSEDRPFPGLSETIETLRRAGIGPHRVILAYNPERQPGTPRSEMDDLAAGVRRAEAMAKAFGAPLLVGPGLREMERRGHLYPELAGHCDIWMIQSQRLQVDPATRRAVPPAEYRRQVGRIVSRLREGRPGIRIFVQLVTTAERGARALTADEIVAYVAAIEDMVEAVRIYGGSAEVLRGVLERLDAPRTDGPTPSPAPVPGADADGPAKRTVRIPMRDAAALATDLYLPGGVDPESHAGGVPVILVCTPYGKSRGKPVDRWRDTFLANGYAFAVQDMRGFHASSGAGRGRPRHYDGYDTVEWLAAQPWCNGKVGMIGYSHLGAVQYETAVTAPPHLACAIPAQAPGNYYTDSDHPPVFRKADMETILRGPFTSRTRQLLRRRVRRREESRIGRFRTPMLHCAGWYDFYTEGAVEMFRACQKRGGDGARGHQKLLIGPWGHGVTQEEEPGWPLRLPGGLAYPPNGKPDWEREVWRPWFDYWLKGRDTGVMDRPAVRYYLMGDVEDPGAPGNVWVEADDFPPRCTPTAYFAHADDTLTADPPGGGGGPLRYAYDPAHPVPTVGRVHSRLPVKGPYDQREVEGRPDVLLFTTPVLTEPLTVVGRIRVRLWASSDRTDTDFTAKVTDVYPDGRSMLVADGIVKGRYRNTFLKEEFLVPGEVYEFEIDLGYTAIVLAAGHRLRLAISSSNFDRFDINPNTGEPYGDHAMTRRLRAERLRAEPRRGEPEYSRMLVATNAVYVDRDHPTQVLLPVAGVAGNAGGGERAASE